MTRNSAAAAPSAQRNFRLGVFNGLLFTVAETLMDPTLVLVAFVSHLTHSPLWLGLVVPLREGAWHLPQLWVSGYLQSQPQKLDLYRRMVVVRLVAWTVLVAAVFVVRHPLLLLIAFMTSFGAYALASGVGGLSFMEVVGKSIPPRKRGVFFAWRLTLGGVGAIGASAVVRWLLDDAGPLSFPYDFGALFAAALLVGAVGLVAFARVNESPDATVRPRASLLAQLRRAVGFVRTDHNYRHFLFLRAAQTAAGAATPFFAIYVQRRLGGPLSMVGLFLAVYTASSLLANVLFGRISTRSGNRRTVVISAWAGLLMAGLVLALMLLAGPLRVSGWAASWWLLPVFVLSGVRDSGLGVGAQSLLLDIAPPGERPVYLGFANSLLGLVLLATGLSGVVVARWGYVALVILALLANLAALAAALRVRDVVEPPAREAEVARLAHGMHPAP